MVEREAPLTKRERAERSTSPDPGGSSRRHSLRFFSSNALPAGRAVRRLRALIRQDLRANSALVHSIRVAEAIACEELEDEGPSFFLKLDSGETLALSGQYLDRHVSHGLPWSELEIRETPHARRFLGIKKVGDSIKPSLVRPQLSVEKLGAFGLLEHRWRLLEIDFESLRHALDQLKR
ncbi:MAG: hypothetical protein ACRD1Z_00265, partial [Vicinamibacteria bacterium]